MTVFVFSTKFTMSFNCVTTSFINLTLTAQFYSITLTRNLGHYLCTTYGRVMAANNNCSLILYLTFSILAVYHQHQFSQPKQRPVFIVVKPIYKTMQLSKTFSLGFFFASVFYFNYHFNFIMRQTFVQMCLV